MTKKATKRTKKRKKKELKSMAMFRDSMSIKRENKILEMASLLSLLFL